MPGQEEQAPEEGVQKDGEATSVEKASSRLRPLRGFQELIKVPQVFLREGTFLRVKGASEMAQLHFTSQAFAMRLCPCHEHSAADLGVIVWLAAPLSQSPGIRRRSGHGAPNRERF